MSASSSEANTISVILVGGKRRVIVSNEPVEFVVLNGKLHLAAALGLDRRIIRRRKRAQEWKKRR